MIEILATPPLNSVQDLGRFGIRGLGLSPSGAMDRMALAAANALIGNDGNAAGIEIQLFPFRARFTADLTFALTGADCGARLDGVPLPPWWVARGRRGQELTLGAPARGARAYLVPRGGIDVPVVLGSRSTQLRNGFGGHEGRALKAGDLLAAAPGPDLAPRDGAGFGGEAPELALTAAGPDAEILLRVIRAGEYEAFTEASRDALWNDVWTVTVQSNRQGCQLAGERRLLLPAPIEMRSHGLMPGVIQVPPAGAPIIQLSDANSAGGYPKIGGVIDADLWRVGQARPGHRLRFVPGTHDEARAAEADNQAYLHRLRRIAGLCLAHV